MFGWSFHQFSIPWKLRKLFTAWLTIPHSNLFLSDKLGYLIVNICNVVLYIHCNHCEEHFTLVDCIGFTSETNVSWCLCLTVHVTGLSSEKNRLCYNFTWLSIIQKRMFCRNFFSEVKGWTFSQRGNDMWHGCRQISNRGRDIPKRNYRRILLASYGTPKGNK